MLPRKNVSFLRLQTSSDDRNRPRCPANSGPAAVGPVLVEKRGKPTFGSRRRCRHLAGISVCLKSVIASAAAEELLRRILVTGSAHSLPLAIPISRSGWTPECFGTSGTRHESAQLEPTVSCLFRHGVLDPLTRPPAARPCRLGGFSADAAQPVNRALPQPSDRPHLI